MANAYKTIVTGSFAKPDGTIGSFATLAMFTTCPNAPAIRTTIDSLNAALIANGYPKLQITIDAHVEPVTI